jgi:L-ascorbate metabolism protein UlaG (beta-lactamase superfamily)
VAELTFHGHSAVRIETDEGQTLFIDPWLDDNPACSIGTADVEHADFILCSHGHFDHYGDVVKLAKQTGALFIGTVELVGHAGRRGVENVHGLNLGGGRDFAFGRVKLTPALHGGQIDDPDAEDGVGGHTTPCGFLFELGGTRLYHAGDTALISDLQLLRGQVDIALLPIGDNFTMGPEDAARAVEMIEPRTVIPIHYDTFPLIAQDPHAFAERVGTRAEVLVLQPGESHSF